MAFRQSFRLVVPGDQTQAVKLGGKCLYPLSYCAISLNFSFSMWGFLKTEKTVRNKTESRLGEVLVLVICAMDGRAQLRSYDILESVHSENLKRVCKDSSSKELEAMLSRISANTFMLFFLM